MRGIRSVLAGLLAGVSFYGVSPALADDLALVLGNRSYENGPYLRSAGVTRAMARELRAAGFDVFEGQDLSGDDMQALAREFATRLGDKGAPHRVVIAMAGHLAGDQWQTWILGTDADAPTALDVGAVGVPLGPLGELAARAPGQAVMMIGLPERQMQPGGGLAAGLGGYQAPQGVTLVLGDLGRMEDMLTRGFLARGTTLKAAADMAPGGVSVTGFVSDAVALLPLAKATAAPVAETPKMDNGELAYWQAAVDIGTVESLLAYVERYPNGGFVAEANKRIGEIRADPERRAREAEEALKLSRDARREIQRNLSLLEFNPRGIDGLFGRGSRAAISDWQSKNGHEATGYITDRQVAQLKLAAQRRAAELAEEARLRRIEEERKDRAYWENTGRAGDEPGLRAYLERYPDGVFAEIAQARLDVFEKARRAETARAEGEAWDAAQRADTIEAYQAFLSEYPRSGFAEAAQARLEELDGEQRNSAQIARDQAEERVIASLAPARLVIEQRLDRIGAKPGPVDGEFTRETRRAIRRFQKHQGMVVTGYVSQETMVRLLAFSR